MAALDDFLPYVLPHVPGCPQVAARIEVRKACRQFCRETRVWKEWLDPVDVVANEGEYALAAPADARVVWVEEVKLGDTRLEPMTRDDALAALGPSWDTTRRGEPSGYYQPDQDTVDLIPCPETSVAGALRVYVSLEVAEDAAAVPDLLAARYREAIAYGALARLLAVPGKPWSNPQAVAYYDGRFSAEMGGVAGRVAAGFTRRPLRTRAVGSL